MKQFSKMSFGLSSVSLAKRGIASEPELIANPTLGNFRMTAPVTRALGIADGDYLMFVSNCDAIDAAINDENPDLVAYCQENNIDMKTPEGVEMIHAAFDQWGIAKGIQEFDAKGNALKTTERWSKVSRIRYVEEHFDELYAKAMEEGSDEYKDALNAEGMLKEDQIKYIAESLSGDEVDKYRGAKCANSSNLKGIGQILTFADASVWAALKRDMKEKAKTQNRIFSVNIAELQKVVINDGCKDVEVKVALLGEYRDEDSSRSKKEEAESEVAE